MAFENDGFNRRRFVIEDGGEQDDHKLATRRIFERLLAAGAQGSSSNERAVSVADRLIVTHSLFLVVEILEQLGR